MGKVKNLEFYITDSYDTATRLGYRFEYNGKPYGDYVDINVLNTTPRELMEDINLLVRMMEYCVKALEQKEETNNG